VLVQLRIPVNSLDCGSRIMERDLHRALGSDQSPNILFTFEEVRGAVSHIGNTDSYHAIVVGQIALAGVSRTLDVPLDLTRIGPDRFRLRASIPVKMTDFGITPPTGLFGAIRARDQLVVTFDLTLQALSRPSTALVTR
jgi:polyisoprenoid-binding protein YceI